MNRSNRVAVIYGLVSLIAGFPPLALSQTETETPVFVGQLGSKDLVFHFLSAEELDFRESVLQRQPQALAEYFDRSVGKVIPLVKSDDGWLIECRATFRSNDCTNPTGYWRTRELPGDGKKGPLTVEWKSNPGDSLIKAIFTVSQLEMSGDLSAWQQLLGTGKTTVSSLPKRKGVSTGILKDERSGVSVPQVFSGYSAEVMKRFNSNQSRELVRRVSIRLENHSMEGDEDDTYGIEYQSPKFLVWAGGTGGYYGGNHGLYGYDVQIYDMKTGDLLRTTNSFLKYDISELIVSETQRLRNSSSKSGVANGNAPADECFSAWLDQVQISEDDRDVLIPKLRIPANHVVASELGKIDLMPQYNGLAIVSNDFPEVIRQCRGIQVIIPWKKLRPYLSQPM